MTYSGFWIYYRTSEMLGWRIGVHYHGQFVGVFQNSKVCDAWWTWSRLTSLLSSGEWLSPFREVISNDQDEAMSFGCWRADESDNIHSTHLKWPWKGYWMKMSMCLIEKVTMDLTGKTSLSISDDVRDHLRPIVAKSSKPVFELRSELVRSTCTIMSFFEALLCLFVWKESY